MLAMRLGSSNDNGGNSREQGDLGKEVAPPEAAWGTFLDGTKVCALPPAGPITGVVRTAPGVSGSDQAPMLCVCVCVCVCVCMSGRVEVQQVSMFLLKGNTLLTFFLTSSRSYTDPLLEQLRGERTLLRNSADASFLMYRVVDTIVDHMELISSEYDRILDSYEAKVKRMRHLSFGNKEGGGRSFFSMFQSPHALIQPVRYDMLIIETIIFTISIGVVIITITITVIIIIPFIIITITITVIIIIPFIIITITITITTIIIITDRMTAASDIDPPPPPNYEGTRSTTTILISMGHPRTAGHFLGFVWVGSPPPPPPPSSVMMFITIRSSSSTQKTHSWWISCRCGSSSSLILRLMIRDNTAGDKWKAEHRLHTEAVWLPARADTNKPHDCSPRHVAFQPAGP